MNYYKECKVLDDCRKRNVYWERKEFEKWFEGYSKIAAETEYPLAECQVGYCYLEGIGTEKDIEKAADWTRKAALHGDRDAQYNLGKMIEDNLLEDTNLETAVYWYQKAAEQGHDLAMKKV